MTYPSYSSLTFFFSLSLISLFYSGLLLTWTTSTMTFLPSPARFLLRPPSTPTTPEKGRQLLLFQRKMPSARPRKPVPTSSSLRASFQASLCPRLLWPPRTSSTWRPPTPRDCSRILRLLLPRRGPLIRSLIPSSQLL